MQELPSAIKADFLGHDILIAPQAAKIGGAWQGKDATGKPQVWDPGTLKFFLEKCDQSTSPFIIDIGANTGCYCLLPIINRQIFCLAFEPNPEAYRLLKKNIILNNIHDNVQTFPIALSNTVGEITLKIPSSGIESGLACLGSPKRFSAWKEASVPQDTLDNVIMRKKINNIDMIKIDTEGCELFVLEGAKNCIHKFKPDILVEFEERNTAQFGYHPDRIQILLEAWGYTFSKLNENDAFFTYKYKMNRRLPEYICEDIDNIQTQTKYKEHPIILISSCKALGNANDNGAPIFNGGYKIYNMWVKLLRKKGFQAFIVTCDGFYEEWLLDHQPCVSLHTVDLWKKAGIPMKFVTGWLEAYAYLERADNFYFYDCELAYTSGHQLPLMRSLVTQGTLAKIATHSRTQQAWHIAQWKQHVGLIQLWCDPDFWQPAPEKRVANRIGYMDEGPHTAEHIALIAERCREAGLCVEFVQVRGVEAVVLATMQQCDIFLGLNLGKDPLFGEGCPMSPHEAMCAGCVVISYDVHGNREYLIPEFSGILVPNGDPLRMAEKVLELLKNCERREKLRSQALLLMKTYTPERIWPDISTFLEIESHAALPQQNVGRMPRSAIESYLGATAWIGMDEIEVLARYASKSERLLEIGAAFGASSFIILASSPKSARLWSIDAFMKDSMRNFQSDPVSCHRNVTSALYSAGHSEAISKWLLMPQSSEEAAHSWKTHQTKLDFLYIDGDHRYEGVRWDFDNWELFVQEGGYILLHDSRRKPGTPEDIFDQGWPGPTQLAQEILHHERFELVEEVFSLSVFKKRC